MKFFDQQSMSLLAVKNASWLILEKLFSMGLVLGVSILIARYLGPTQFGLLNYLLAIVALLGPVSALGLNSIITRELVSKVDKQEEIMATALVLRSFGAVIAGLLLYLLFSLGYITKIESSAWWLFLLAVVNIFAALQVIDFWFQAKVLSKYVVKARLSALLVSSAVKLLLVYYDATFTAFVFAMAFETLLISVAFGIIYLYKAKIPRLSAINWQYSIELLKQSKWLILSGVASIIYLKIDQLMLAEMVSTAEVGVYAVASRISEVWYFFPIAIVSSFFPSLIHLKSVDTLTYQKKLQQLCDFLFLLALLLAIFFSYTANGVVTLLFGNEYAGAGVILSLHIWAGLFVFMRELLSKWLIAENLIVFSLVTHGIGAIVNVVLNYYLIPLYLGLGAAIATVISYAFASYITLFFHASTRPMAKIMTRSLFFPLRFLLRG